MNQDDRTPIDPGLFAPPPPEAPAAGGGGDDRTPRLEDRSRDSSDPSTLDEFATLEGYLRLLAGPSGGKARGWDGGQLPRRVGRFEVLGELGRGGFGVVFKAFDPMLGRAVALKVPHSSALISPGLEQRFLREARAAGSLDHPNIGPVFEAGRAGPLCYIASALCEGPNLAAWLDRRGGPAPPRVAAAIVARLADAVRHAHERGILHRDLKPSNVLLWPEPAGSSAGGAGPDASGLGFVPKLTDFGLARIAEEAGEETRTGVPIGSPPYMAPEQAAGRNREVGPPADVYGLGAILYELLTGRPPFRGESNPETIRMVLELEVVPPRSLRPGVPRDLETICLACLEKERRRRYGTSAELADDLRRFLDGRPVRARRASAPERAWRSARRRPWRTAALTLLALATAGTVAGVSASNARLRVERDRADRSAAAARRSAAEANAQRRLSERYLHASRLREARSALEADQVERAQEVLAQPVGDGFAAGYLRRRALRDFRLLHGHDRPVATLFPGPGDRLASVDWEGRVITWDLARGRELHRAEPPEGYQGRIAPGFSDPMILVVPERHGPGGWPVLGFGLREATTGRRVAGMATEAPGSFSALPLAGGDVLEVVEIGTDGAARVGLFSFEAGRLRQFAEIGPVRLAGTSPGGDALLTYADGMLRRIDARSGAVRHEVAVELPGLDDCYRFDADPDGRLALIGRRDGPLLVIDADSGAVIGTIPTRDIADPVLFAPDGAAIAALEHSGRIHLWDRPDGRERCRVLVESDRRPEPGQVRAAFNPDGRLIAVGNWATATGTARPEVVEVASGRVVATFPGSPTFAGPLAFAPDGRSVLVTSGVDVAVWPIDRPADPPGPAGHSDEGWSVAFSPDGSILATGADDTDDPRTLRIWDVATGAERLGWMAHPATVSALDFSPDGSLLASAALGVSENLRLWDPGTGALVAELEGHTAKVRTVRFSPDGSLLVSAGDDGTVRVWDIAKRSLHAVLSGHDRIVRDATFLADGRAVASVGSDRTLRFWDVAAGRQARLVRFAHEPLSLALSPDGETLAVGDHAGHLEILDARSGDLLRSIRDADGELRAVAFAPDGSAVAVAGTNRSIRLWDPVTAQELLALDGHDAQVNDLAFAPDGSALASCSHDGDVRLWRADDPPASP